jgi:hypothetical protein
MSGRALSGCCVLALSLGACTSPRQASSESADTTAGDTSAGDTTSEPTTGEPTGPAFVESDDLPPDYCDSFAQDCPEGEKCVPASSNWNTHQCVPVLGDQAVGEPCVYYGTAEATDDCDADGHCWNVANVDGELVGICHAFCAGSPDDPMCPLGSTCSISSEGSIGLCEFGCDPVVQDCGPGLACIWYDNSFGCILTGANDIPTGEPCGYINDCAAGHICLDGSFVPDCAGSACCTPFCHVDLGDAQCELVPGTVCVSFFVDEPPPGYEHVGVCIATPP